MRVMREPGRLVALLAAVIAHAAVLIAAIALLRDARDSGSGPALQSIRILSVGPQARAEAAPKSADSADMSSRLEQLQQTLAPGGPGAAYPPAPSNGGSGRRSPGGLDGLETALTGPGGASGSTTSIDPYSRASFDPRELASSRSSEVLIRSQAARCLGDTEDMTPVRLVVRLRPDGGLAGTPRAIRTLGAARPPRLRTSEAQAVQAVVQCAPYTAAARDGRAGAFEIELGATDY